MTFAFAISALDRRGDRRQDAAWLAARHAASTTRYVVLHDSRPLIAGAGDPRVHHPRQVAGLDLTAMGVTEEMAFLGMDGTGAVFAAHLSSTSAARLDGAYVDFADLRSLAISGRFPPDALSQLAYARALFHWHATHRFCAACGEPSIVADAGHRRDCPACGAKHFPHQRH